MSIRNKLMAVGSTAALTLGVAVAVAAPASAEVCQPGVACAPDGHALTCQTASVYEHWSPDLGRFGTNWTMFGPGNPYGRTPERFGHTEGVHRDVATYAYGQDFGYMWGYILHSCISPVVS